MLISDEYKKLQIDLHARYDYGKGADALECAAIVRKLAEPGSTVLDYGCGQGKLGVLLNDYDLEEYDPCIEGKDEEPARADVVVCADVLEHIEPELLDNVLLHIRSLVRKHAIFIIATEPSNKIMADGRQAHLIVEGSGYWFMKLTGMFNFESFIDRQHEGKGLLITCTPRAFKTETLIPIARVRGTSAVDDAMRNANVAANCAVTTQRLALKVAPHGRVAHLACFGPSLKDTWPSLVIAHAKGGDIFTCSGAHDFLMQKGVKPKAHMDCDPRPHKAGMVTPSPDVEYWLASCIDPNYLEKLSGHKVSLWHSYNGKASREAFKIDPGHRMVVGGGSIGMRALSVLYCQGYREFEIHGMDCSFIGDDHHAAEHPGKNHDAVPVKCGDRWFKANAVMLLYARYFRKQVKLMQNATLRLHGDGLLQHMMKIGG